jgi:hypothetical protein
VDVELSLELRGGKFACDGLEVLTKPFARLKLPTKIDQINRYPRRVMWLLGNAALLLRWGHHRFHDHRPPIASRNLSFVRQSQRHV